MSVRADDWNNNFSLLGSGYYFGSGGSPCKKMLLTNRSLFDIISMKSMFCITFQKGVNINMDKPEGKYAWTVTVGTKGQIVLPKEAREVFDINPGDTLIILGDKQQGMAIPLKNQFSEFFGKIFKK